MTTQNNHTTAPENPAGWHRRICRVPKSNVVAPVVAIRPELPLVSVSLPVENVLVPPVCHDRELVLLKVELAVPERSTAPMSVPALLIVRFPERTVEVTLPTVTDVVGALIAKAETLPEFVVIVPLLVSVILPAETLPFGVEINRTVAALAEAPTAFSVALEPTVTLTVPVPPSARMALPLPLPETLPTVIEPFATTVMLPVPTVVDTLPPPLMTDAVMPCEPAPEMLPEALALFAVIVLLLVMLMLPAPAPVIKARIPALRPNGSASSLPPEELGATAMLVPEPVVTVMLPDPLSALMPRLLSPVTEIALLAPSVMLMTPEPVAWAWMPILLEAVEDDPTVIDELLRELSFSAMVIEPLPDCVPIPMAWLPLVTVIAPPEMADGLALLA